MAKVLVTGGTGFVGAELVLQLLERGDEVSVLTRSAEPVGPDGVMWIRADLSDAGSLWSALAGRRFECIYHVASLPCDTGDPEEMVRVNIGGATHMLEFARRSGAGRFVLTSSISAYGWFPSTKFDPPLEMPVTEEHISRPKDMYCATKRAQEILATTFHHEYGVPTVALRVTAVIGPRGHGGGRMWQEFAEQLAGGEWIQLPQMSEDDLSHFVDVRDVAAMHIAAGTEDGAVGEAFNCCGPGPTRGHEFAEIVTGIAPGIEVKYGFPWSMSQGGELAFDMSKAKRLIGFEPQYSVADSVRCIKEWADAGGLEDSGA